MQEGEMIRTEEATDRMRSVNDPITTHLINKAMHHLIRRYQLQKDRPTSDLDLDYLVALLIDVFSDHNALKRILNGETVGALYDDDLLKSFSSGQ
jgi:hypothetical protein